MAFVASTTGQDREDWVGIEAMNAAPLWRNLSGTINHNETTGLFDVRRWAYLQFTAFNLTAVRTMWILVQWFDDPATLNIIGTVNYTCRIGARIVDCVPNIGPYCLVTVFWDDAANHAATCIIMGRNSPTILGVGDGGVSNVTNQVATAPFQAIGALGNVVGTTAFVQHGWATLTLNSDSAGVVAQVQPITTAGALSGDAIAILQTGAANFTRLMVTFPLPTHQVQLQVVNLNGFGVGAGAVIIIGPSP